MQLTIAIPTFNRADKLSRLLALIRNQLISNPFLLEKVEILVSNNCSTDDTSSVLEKFETKGVHFRYLNQKQNIGFDRNVICLYTNARGRYVWFSADDDIFYDGAITKMISTLDECSPTIFLTSFMQPPGTYLIRFNYQEFCTHINDSKIISDLVLSTVKITSYIVKRFDFTEPNLEVLDSYIGSDYGHVALAFTALLSDDSPQLCVISEALTGSDNEYNLLRFEPDVWGKLWTICKHPYLRLNHPDLLNIQKRNSYFTMLEIFCKIIKGELIVENINEYYESLRRIKFHPLYFLKKPKYFKKYLLLKKTVYSWP